MRLLRRTMQWTTLRTMLACLPAAGAAGAALPDAVDGAWTVPSAPATVEIWSEGVATTARAHTVGQIPGTNDVWVERILADGSLVRPGDRMIEFDRDMLEQRLGGLRGDLAVAEATLRQDSLRLDQQLATLLASREDKRMALAVAVTAIASAEAGDAATRALLVDQVRVAEGAVADAERALARVTAAQAAGQASAVELSAAQAALAQARAGCALPRERLRLFDLPGETIATARLRLQARQLRADLGLDEDGKPQPGAGIDGRIAALRDQQSRQRDADAIERDRVADALHRGERDADDHTPLQWVELTPLAGTVGTALRVVFAPAGTTDETTAAPDGPRVVYDSGAAFSAERGHGWDRERTAAVVARGGQPAQTLALIQGEAHWRIALADGRWRVRLGFGDDRDWSGAVARLATAEGQQRDAVFVARLIDAGDHPEATAEIAVAGGWLEVVCGDGCAKALRATSAGIVTHPEWVGPGYKVGWPGDTIAYLAEPGSVAVAARVRQQDAVWLRARADAGAGAGAGATGAATDAPAGGDATSEEGPAAEAALDRLRGALAATAVAVVTPAGDELPGVVDAISDQPVALARRPESWVHNDFDLDLTAVEATVTVAPELVARLRPGEDERVRATFALPAGVAAVPGHLVAEVGERRWIQEAGAAAPRAVAACRAGGTWLVPGLRPGTRLVPPDTGVLAAVQGHPHPGEVIAGKRSPVTMFHSWGRIKTLVPDGSVVTAGQEVVTLYNPSIEDQHAQLEQDKRRAQQAFLLAVENRRLQALDDAALHRATVLAADGAELDLLAAGARDAEAMAKATAAATAAATVAGSDQAILAAARAMAGRDPSRAAAAEATAALSAIALTRARLDAVAADRGADWVGFKTAAGAFDDAEAALSARGDAFVLAGKQEQAAAMGAKLLLAHALAGGRWEQSFRDNRVLRAPASGRLFYLVGWNDQTNGPGKFQNDYWVWGGLPVAEVLDMSKLAFRAELPEIEYPHLRLGDHLDLRFPQIDPRRIPATVSAVGRAFTPAKEDGGRGARTRVFTATLDFEPPADLQQRLVPGTKGEVVLP